MEPIVAWSPGEQSVPVAWQGTPACEMRFGKLCEPSYAAVLKKALQTDAQPKCKHTKHTVHCYAQAKEKRKGISPKEKE